MSFINVPFKINGKADNGKNGKSAEKLIFLIKKLFQKLDGGKLKTSL